MFGELTDDVIRANLGLMEVIESNREQLDEMGWGGASLTDQYNMAVSLELAAADS